MKLLSGGSGRAFGRGLGWELGAGIGVGWRHRHVVGRVAVNGDDDRAGAGAGQPYTGVSGAGRVRLPVLPRRPVAAFYSFLRSDSRSVWSD